MTATSKQEILDHLERECRPEGQTFSVDMKPHDIELLHELAAEWDTHPINALGRAVQLAVELQEAARTGHKVLVRHPRPRLSIPAPWRRNFYTEVLAARWKGPSNP